MKTITVIEKLGKDIKVNEIFYFSGKWQVAAGALIDLINGQLNGYTFLVKSETNHNSGALDFNAYVKKYCNETPEDREVNIAEYRGYLKGLLPKQEIKYPTEAQIGDMLHKENLLGCGRPYLTADRTIDLIKSLNQ